jgi:hypothetical protein
VRVGTLTVIAELPLYVLEENFPAENVRVLATFAAVLTIVIPAIET